ncbi:MAG: carbon monoxide dehydrogenase subunit G [Chloroflexi bacterium]|nr:carbon monoxide dehydrogenase subunit G [Chloroflexota bacterium]
MIFEGSVNIHASRQQVWEFLTDAEKVTQCAPGVESVEVLIPNEKFRATAAIGFGSVKARFVGEGEFVEMDPPHRARLKAHGAAPGSAADIDSEMILSEGPDGSTDMKWTANVMILGTLASLAARLMGSITHKLTAEFFTCLKKRIEA